jgi:putative flippase GtrA
MLPVSTPAETRIVSGKKRGFFRHKVEWLFTPELFHLKLLIGKAVGVLVTIVLAVACAVFTFRHRHSKDLNDALGRSSHQKRVLQIREIVRNWLMTSLLSNFQLFRLGNDQLSANRAWRCTN